MLGDNFDFLTDQSTLLAVVLGALLATIGGFGATQLERFLDKRERERNAALFFGEVLSTLAIILAFAEETRGIGDPYGPITMRMLHSARRELDIYDRNRESLFDLRHADLRARIQTLIIRMSIPLEAVIEATPEIHLLRAQLKTAPSRMEQEELTAQIAQAETRRDTGFGFIVETAGKLKSVIKDLEPLARHSFERLDQVARNFERAIQPIVKSR